MANCGSESRDPEEGPYSAWSGAGMMVGGGLSWEPRMQAARRAGAGVDTGRDKEMALTLQCPMPRQVAGVTLKVFRLSLLLALWSPCWVSQSPNSPSPGGPESGAPGGPER